MSVAMHELSIATALVELAEAEARRAGARKVIAVTLRLGTLAGVVADALRFCYDIATEATLLEGSRLIIEDVPVVVHCDPCGREVEVANVLSFCCPLCGTPSVTIRRGRELELESIEIEAYP